MTISWVSTLLDLVPIIGSIKNTVEAVAALCHGDIQLAEEKGFQAVVGGALDVVTLGTGGIVERLVVKGVEEGGEKIFARNIISQLSKDGVQATIRGTSKMTVAELAVYRMALKKKETETKGKQKKPSRRGEHVINNNVLKFFRSVIEAFISKAKPGQSFDFLVSSGRMTPDKKVYQAYGNPLTPPYKAAVQNELVAHILDDEPYIDANAVMYGHRIEQLRGTIVTYMLAIYHRSNENLPKMERVIIEEVEEFIAGQYFVDQHALHLWLQQGGTMGRYHDVKTRVVEMFRRLEYHSGNDEVIQWVRDLSDALA